MRHHSGHWKEGSPQYCVSVLQAIIKTILFAGAPAVEKPKPPPSEEDLRDIHNLDCLVDDVVKRARLMHLHAEARSKEARAAGIGKLSHFWGLSPALPACRRGATNDILMVSLPHIRRSGSFQAPSTAWPSSGAARLADRDCRARRPGRRVHRLKALKAELEAVSTQQQGALAGGTPIS